MVPLFTVIFVSKMACHLGIQNEIQALSDLITSKETFALIRPTLSRLLLNSFLHSSFFISSCVDNYGSITTVLKTVKHSQVNVVFAETSLKYFQPEKHLSSSAIHKFPNNYSSQITQSPSYPSCPKSKSPKVSKVQVTQIAQSPSCSKSKLPKVQVTQSPCCQKLKMFKVQVAQSPSCPNSPNPSCPNPKF